MNDCETFEPTIQAYVAGELGESDLGSLLTHCRNCKDCRQLLELHRDLTDLAARAPEPDQAELDAMHGRVLAWTARSQPAGVASVDEARSSRAAKLPASTWRVAGAIAAGLLLFVVGLGLGRGWSTSTLTPSPANGNGSSMARLVSAISHEAASNRALTDVEDSRFILSNVSFRRVDAEHVAVDFDATTHVQLVEPVRSELVREALVHSLLNPSTIGTRLKAMSYAAGAMEPKVVEALVFAMRRDDSLAVRLQALTILADQLHDADVEAAVLDTLREDESVQMRLLALDYLAGHSTDRDRIREVIRQSERPGEEALRVRLAQYDEGV